MSGVLCRKCGVDKKVAEYYLHKGRLCHYVCKECIKIQRTLPENRAKARILDKGRFKNDKRRLYCIYTKILHRCNNMNYPSYPSYGGRGIKCMREDFESFYRDMVDSYIIGLSIDRIDNSRGYSKDNCRRATQKEQSNNRRSNHMVECLGDSLTLRQFTELYDLPYQRTWKAINKDRPLEYIIENKHKKRRRTPFKNSK